MSKPFSESSEENKHVILSVLQKIYVKPGMVLEVGSGTGQHAVFFAEKLPRLRWQPTDVEKNLAGIQAWLQESDSANLLPPRELDVTCENWAMDEVNYVFSANTVHIMSWDAVKGLFSGLGRVLMKDGLFALYGPFNYDGQFTSDSNAHFDQWLRQRDPLSGIREFGDLNQLAGDAGMELVNDVEMPVNNRILVWKKTQGSGKG